MARQEQFDLLRKGVKEWNAWREQNRGIPIDFVEASLNKLELGGINLRGANLSRAFLGGAFLYNSDLSGANLRSASLSGAFLHNADLNGANLSEANLSGANFDGANLSEAKLSGAKLEGASLCGAFLHNAFLNDAFLYNANLRRARLYNADLHNTDFSRTNLSNANLSGADLSKAFLHNANLSGADLSKAFLYSANLNTVDLNNADLSGTIIGATILGNLDLSTTKGLETIQHIFPSTIGVDTLERSHGAISEDFLRKAGLSEAAITYARSFAQPSFQYYTCFMSYASKDQKFAQCLYEDLQREGIRCWFALEDMEIGDKIKRRIDESIWMYDKLLLILSEHSIASPWVAYEVEKALSKEPQGIPNVVYPVRVDQAILTCKTDWARDIKETRHIGDFEQWTDPEKYQVSLQRLLRALRGK